MPVLKAAADGERHSRFDLAAKARWLKAFKAQKPGQGDGPLYLKAKPPGGLLLLTAMNKHKKPLSPQAHTSEIQRREQRSRTRL